MKENSVQFRRRSLFPGIIESLYPLSPGRSAELSDDVFCGSQIDDELELRRLLNWQISRLGAFQNLVDIGGGAPMPVSKSSRRS